MAGPGHDADEAAACANSAAAFVTAARSSAAIDVFDAGDAPVGAAALRIGGRVPMSTVDWPGQLAAVLFLQGCPWRCTYCHNPDLQPACGDGRTTWNDVESLLEQRVGLLDGVVFSGGEPTAQAALVDAVLRTRELGFACALHTAGIYPARVARVLPHLDWIALDIKTIPDEYDRLTRTPGSARRVEETLDLVIASGKPFECRTTVDWALLSPADLLRIGEGLAARGVKSFAVQVARATGPHYRPGGDSRGSEAVFARLTGMFPEFICR